MKIMNTIITSPVLRPRNTSSPNPDPGWPSMIYEERRQLAAITAIRTAFRVFVRRPQVLPDRARQDSNATPSGYDCVKQWGCCHVVLVWMKTWGRDKRSSHRRATLLMLSQRRARNPFPGHCYSAYGNNLFSIIKIDYLQYF